MNTIELKEDTMIDPYNGTCPCEILGRDKTHAHTKETTVFTDDIQGVVRTLFVCSNHVHLYRLDPKSFIEVAKSDGATAAEFANLLFEFEYCDESGLDAEDHTMGDKAGQ